MVLLQFAVYIKKMLITECILSRRTPVPCELQLFIFYHLIRLKSFGLRRVFKPNSRLHISDLLAFSNGEIDSHAWRKHKAIS